VGDVILKGGDRAKGRAAHPESVKCVHAIALAVSVLLVSACHSQARIADQASLTTTLEIEILGRAIDSRTARPVAATVVNIVGRTERVQTDSLGMFALAMRISAGSHLLELRRVAYSKTEVAIAVDRAGRLDLLDIPQRYQYPLTSPPTPEPKSCRVVLSRPTTLAAGEEVRAARDSTGMRWHICMW
jgi:hypothetical protein